MGGRSSTLASIMLTKHHGLGNDFLIAVEPDREIGSAEAVKWCDRRRGLGADGLIVARPAGEDPATWVMRLWNADGGRAELSGNGLRCLGQALVLHRDDGGQAKTFRILTDAGPRLVEVHPDRGSHTDQVRVDMGSASSGPGPFDGWDQLGLAAKAQIGVDMGNPHLVVLVDEVGGVDLAAIGPVVEATYPEGVNVELITTPDRGTVELRVWERGAGITEACGSGACAAAWAARQWGLVDDRVAVVMPGGTALVETVGDSLILTGPSTFVAIVEIEQP